YALDDSLEAKVLLLMRSHPQITQTELAERLKVSRATIQRSIKSLTDENKIARSGGKRFGTWEVF
ncbi:MAG: helix-turn-helix domain-containing protein, partial [Eubacteriales bacterium]|nr:helix-turn-helix domain-containing protein [Eubacteriales bacterium]